MNLNNRWLIGAIPAALLSGAVLWEGVRYVPYKDIVGIPTVCSGYTKDVKWGKRYSQEECSALLRTELKEHSDGVLKCVKVPLKEYEYSAYVLFAYNVGVYGFCNSTALKLLNQEKRTEACDALGKWVYAGGKYSQGLANRRAYEIKMCKGINYGN